MSIEAEDNVPELAGAVLVWGIVSLVFAIIVLVNNNAPAVLASGFFAKFFATIVGTILGTVGAVVGDKLRLFVHPSSVYTSGGFFSLLWIKVFWALGPQVIGMCIGVFFGITLVL